MRRWLVALLSALVASGVGVTVNVATDLGTNVWAWVALGVLTLAAAGVAVWAQRGEPEGAAARTTRSPARCTARWSRPTR